MNKPLIVLYGPVDVYAGYGARSRDLATALLKLDKYELKIISCPWGSCTKGFLKEDNKEHKAILNCILSNNQLPKQPDVWIMNTIPNEMQRVGKFNILITAGIETTVASPQWIEGLKNADLVLTSSEHAKQVFLNSKFEKRNGQTQQVEEIIECKTPIEVLMEGVSLETYFKLDKVEGKINDILNEVKEDFAFLFVGHWLQGEHTQDRKNVGGLIQTFLETFKGKKTRPALILKTQGANPSITDKEQILDKLNKIQKLVGDDGLPSNIYLIHGELTDKEINELYNHPKIKAHVSFTRGEGYGRPLLEASLSQKPIIAPNWSGQLEFLNPEFSTLIPGKIEQIHQSATVKDILVPESGWFTVDYKKSSSILEDVYKNYKNYFEKSKRQSYFSKTNFSLDAMSKKLGEILDNKVPKTVELTLPKLKRVE